MDNIRRYVREDFEAVLRIINAAAVSYRGVIPPEHWDDPYMSAEQLRHEIEASVKFWVYTEGTTIRGVMGIQRVSDLDLVRHAYVCPDVQSAGIGGKLLTHLRRRTRLPLVVGTWGAAMDAIRFYQRHGFVLVEPTRAQQLLRRYWDVSEQQMRHSVVLAEPDVIPTTDSAEAPEL